MKPAAPYHLPGEGMYLTCLERGHRFPARQLLRLSRVFLPHAPLDIVRVLMYRPEYFGRPFCRIGQFLMRGPEEIIGWSIGERELLERWSTVEQAQVTVIETAPWEGVVLDGTGECRLVGWESSASSHQPVGSEFSCRVLPTLVPDEHLLVRWTVPTPW